MQKEKSGTFSPNFLRRSERLHTVTTVILIVLMILYLVMTAGGSLLLTQQTDIISNHPFEVVIAAGDVKLYVSEMRVRTERLLRHNSEEDILLVTQALNDLRASLEGPLGKMEDLYLGTASDISALEDTLARLHGEQDAFLTYAAKPSVTGPGIEAYAEEHLDPLYEQVLAQTEAIVNVAQAKKVGYGQTSEALRRMMVGGSILLMVFMVGVLLLSYSLLRRQQQELARRSRLFDDLSLNIDDTFVIRNAKTGRVDYCALNMERVLGISLENGKDAYQGISAADAADIRRAAAAPEPPVSFEKMMAYTKPNGEKRWIFLRLYRTGTADEPQVISVFSDRTEEVLSRQALQDAMLSAERANTAKSDFLSRMSHEIRTPLNAIIGMTTIAAASVQDPAHVEDCLAKINYSSKHLLMLVNDVLDMSKIESNKMVLQKEPFDLFQLVSGFATTVYSQARAKDIDFEEHMDGFSGHTAYLGDPLRLNQILLNLSSNAVKFTSPGGRIRLEVTLLASKNRVDVLRFSLSDTGIGMAPETVEKIFQPFEQADASISGRFGGTGLGMSITRNLVMLMDGTIRVESKLGVGSTFIVELPLQRAEPQTVEPDFANQGLCALVVDDEQQVCEQTSLLLERIKIRSEWKLSGGAAVERVKEAHRSNQDFDLCLIDWKMPDMDGIEVTRRIRREVGAELPIVMISAYDISEVEQQAREAGVNGFLPKPLYRSSVYAAIKEALAAKGDPLFSSQPLQPSQPLAGQHLLIAEGNELNREIAEELLKMHGAQVRCATNGQEALDLFLASAPGDYDAILMDVQMPVMNGYDAARQIRASAPPLAARIPIIATTANAFSDDITAALAAGMNAHVSKPLDIAQLCRVLAECIHRAANA